jgi:hypothetical protein
VGFFLLYFKKNKYLLENKKDMKITKEQLKEAVKKEVLRLNKISLLTEGNLYEGELPSVSPEALIEPLETEQVYGVDGVELMELTWQDGETLFGGKRGEGDGIMAIEFPEIFSREAMESYLGEKIDDYYLPIEREMLWLKLVEPIALHYTYGFEGHSYSKSEAAEMAKQEGKKYVIAQYMS